MTHERTDRQRNTWTGIGTYPGTPQAQIDGRKVRNSLGRITVIMVSVHFKVASTNTDRYIYIQRTHMLENTCTTS